MGRRVDPFEETVAAVDTIPGIGRRTAEVIVAEMGTDMSRFPSAGHLASWAGVCPGNNRSAEKHKRAPTKKGNGWLKAALVEAARSAARTKTYLGAQYQRLARRIGANRAAMAVAHSIAVILHQVIKTGKPFARSGPPLLRRARPRRHRPPVDPPTRTPRLQNNSGSPYPPSRLNLIFIIMTVGVITMTMPCAEGAGDLLMPKYLYASVLGKVNPQHRSPGEREHEKTLLALQSTIRVELTGDCSSECGD